MNIRKLALNMLDEYELGEKYVNLLLSSHSADSLTREERAALTALLYTTVERKITYDYYICNLSKRSLERFDPHTLNILRLGACQILDMESIPDFAAVNETVKLARSAGERSLVNGVLRALVRTKDALPMPDEAKNYRRYLSVKYAFPLWIVKLLDEHYGREATERMLDRFNVEKYTDITVNTLKTTADALIARLAEQGIEATDNYSLGASLRIHRSVNPESLAGFSDGAFFVQDRACIVSAMALNPSEGETVIDVCACPGGKSFATAILMRDSGRIYSFDLHESKLSLIRDGAARLGLRSISVAQRDATAPDETLIGRADKVICDVPCSGLGVLGKKPDLRYKDASVAEELTSLQLDILTKSVGYLKQGGELLYSTCTLNPAENAGVVNAFLAEHSDEYELCDFTVGELCSSGGMLTLLPHIDGCDGFFMAKIRRKQV